MVGLTGQPEKHGLYDMRTEEPTPTDQLHHADHRGCACCRRSAAPARLPRHDHLAGRRAPFCDRRRGFRQQRQAHRGHLRGGRGQGGDLLQAGDVAHRRLRRKRPAMRQASTNFGWNADKTAYMVPGGQITANGFQEADASAAQVDLSDQEFAKRLGLRPIPTDQLAAIKRHIVDDLLQLCPDAKVGYALLAGAALSVLYRFTDGMNRVLLWVVGLSGNGKSFMAKLFQNLFGNFPIAGEKAVISWASTVNRIQHEGYYFRDAMYLVDDYKPEHCPPRGATWLLQAYADSAARSRLRSDATAAETREIRGFLVCTGEDVPDHSASATARLIKIPYPVGEKDLERGRRCQQQRVNYPGVMADFIRHVIANNRGPAFAARVGELQASYYREIKGSDNDMRIAGNFAMLAAAFEEIADYLRDVWQGADEAKQAFVERHIPELRQATLADVSDQKASRLFLSTLAGLVQQGPCGSMVICRAPLLYKPDATLIGKTVPADQPHGQEAQGSTSPPARRRLPRRRLSDGWGLHHGKRILPWRSGPGRAGPGPAGFTAAGEAPRLRLPRRPCCNSSGRMGSCWDATISRWHVRAPRRPPAR